MSATSETAPPAKGAGPERASSFSLDVERQTVAGAFRAYIGKLRSGDPGALPSVLGLVVLVIIFAQVSDRFLIEEQHRQPARPGRLHRGHRHGPGLRAAARRDRPVGRHDRRHVCGVRGPRDLLR